MSRAKSLKTSGDTRWGSGSITSNCRSAPADETRKCFPSPDTSYLNGLDHESFRGNGLPKMRCRSSYLASWGNVPRARRYDSSRFESQERSLTALISLISLSVWTWHPKVHSNVRNTKLALRFNRHLTDLRFSGVARDAQW